MPRQDQRRADIIDGAKDEELSGSNYNELPKEFLLSILAFRLFIYNLLRMTFIRNDDDDDNVDEEDLEANEWYSSVYLGNLPSPAY